jgi:hypothetical protein
VRCEDEQQPAVDGGRQVGLAEVDVARPAGGCGCQRCSSGPVFTAAEGIGYALIGGVGLAVDAVGYIFSRTTTLCPARRATSVAGTPGVPARSGR